MKAENERRLSQLHGKGREYAAHDLPGISDTGTVFDAITVQTALNGEAASAILTLKVKHSPRIFLTSTLRPLLGRRESHVDQGMPISLLSFTHIYIDTRLDPRSRPFGQWDYGHHRQIYVYS